MRTKLPFNIEAKKYVVRQGQFTFLLLGFDWNPLISSLIYEASKNV